MGSIRGATPADLDTLSSPIAALPLMRRYGNDAGTLAKIWREALVRGDRIYVACGNQGPCGLCWFMPSGTLGVGGYLRLIALTPEAQGTGIGAELLETFERETFVHSKNAFLLVSDFNTAAQRFYERQGYVRTGALADLVVPGVSELLYWKKRPATPP